MPKGRALAWAAFPRARPFCFCAFGFKRISCSHFQVGHLDMLPFPAWAKIPVCLQMLKHCGLETHFNSGLPKQTGGLPGACMRCKAGTLPPAFSDASQAFMRSRRAKDLCQKAGIQYSLRSLSYRSRDLN